MLHSGGRLIQGSLLIRVIWIFPMLATWIWFTNRNQIHWSRHRAPISALCLAMAVYLFSSAATNPTFYYMKWVPATQRGFWSSGLERMAIITCVLAPIILLLKRRIWILLAVILVTTQVAAFLALWHATGGDPLYRVDHPSFFYRLWSFGQSIPRFIYYDPFWNGGKVMPYLVASGILSPGLFLWPLWKYVPTEIAYTPGFGLLFIVIVPLLSAYSARLISRNPIMPFVAALLAMGTSHFFFIHLVHYGTMGSLFAAAFLMPLCAALYRLVMRQQSDTITLLTLFVSGFFMLCWPPSVIMAIPIGIALICNIRRLTIRTTACLAGFIASMCLLFALPVLSLFSHSEIGTFMKSSTAPFSSANLKVGLGVVIEFLRQSHPVILFLGIAGSCLTPSRNLRRLFAPILLVSLLVAVIGADWKPDLQLDRVVINALYIAILPASWCMAMLFQSRSNRLIPALALLIAALCMGGYNTIKYMGNEGRARFRTMSDEVSSMVSWIQNNTPTDGRIMFAGAAVHGYSAAKVAALPVYTDREMMSCDYYGFSPRLVEYNYPTREFRKHGPEKLFQFMELYNITHIITYHDDWKRLFRNKLADQYQEVANFGKKTIFRVKRTSSKFLDGSGSVVAGINYIDVSVYDQKKPVVIKYNWVDGISCTPDKATLEPFDTGTSVKLIKIKPNGAKYITISYDRLY